LGDPTTWATWLSVLKAAFGEKLNRADRRAFKSVAGSRKPPRHKVKELWAIVGRGGGKSRMSAAIAVYLACIPKHDLDPGEVGYVLALAGSRDQAGRVFDYALAFIRQSPILRKLIKSTTAYEIRLKNNVVIAVHSNSFRLIRGRTLLPACCMHASPIISASMTMTSWWSAAARVNSIPPSTSVRSTKN
jgi:hypothetical protein